MQDFFSIQDLADRWRVSTSTVRRLIARGELAKVYVMAQVRIEGAEVERWEREARKGKAKSETTT